VEGKALYLRVIEEAAKWGTPDNIMFVVGATQSSAFEEIRKIVPEHFLLVPGIGAQGGDLDEVCKFGINKDIGLLVNSSRTIIYAGQEQDFAEKAAAEAKRIAEQMRKYF
jgi:orotidine-5'-phosphate decarboxylase